MTERKKKQSLIMIGTGFCKAHFLFLCIHAPAEGMFCCAAFLQDQLKHNSMLRLWLH
jgi:hypothetical protein